MTKKPTKQILLISFFLIFPFWLPKFVIFDLKIEFLVKNCIYSQFPRSRILRLSQKMRKYLFNKIFFLITSLGYKFLCPFPVFLRIEQGWNQRISALDVRKNGLGRQGGKFCSFFSWSKLFLLLS